MMIKSEIKENKAEPEVTYPRLMQSKDTGSVVIQRAKAEFGSFKGAVIVGDMFKKVGYYSESWTEDCFKPLYATIEITGE